MPNIDTAKLKQRITHVFAGFHESGVPPRGLALSAGSGPLAIALQVRLHVESYDGEDAEGFDDDWECAYVCVSARFGGKVAEECAGSIEDLTEESLRDALARALCATRKTPSYTAARTREHLMMAIPRASERRSISSV